MESADSNKFLFLIAKIQFKFLILTSVIGQFTCRLRHLTNQSTDLFKSTNQRYQNKLVFALLNKDYYEKNFFCKRSLELMISNLIHIACGIT